MSVLKLVEGLRERLAMPIYIRDGEFEDAVAAINFFRDSGTGPANTGPGEWQVQWDRLTGVSICGRGAVFRPMSSSPAARTDRWQAELDKASRPKQSGDQKYRAELDKVKADLLQRQADAEQYGEALNSGPGCEPAKPSPAIGATMARPKLRDDGIPTRSDWRMMSAAERSILTATQVVEMAGASRALTDAVVLLDKARERVADHMEGEVPPDEFSRGKGR